jgi:poly-gamma-glutamate synthesis protein (capsule biosynthesis protein)
VLFLGLALAAGCDGRSNQPAEPDAGAVTDAGAGADAEAEAVTDAGADSATLTLLAAGDASFGRMIGQILLREPGRDLFAPARTLLDAADVRFVNLEGPISDQGSETVSPENNLVFNGPPAAASALARAHVDIVSTANNHAWDYGRKALLETLAHLDRAGVRHAGTGNTLAEALRPAFVEANGSKLALLAVTDIWNQGSLARHPAREHVARADEDALVAAVRALRADPSVAFVVVSYHGGEEYRDDPLPAARKLAMAVLDAGADAFLGHHPHVPQGLAFHAGKPIAYSLGNVLMRMASGRPWTEMGLAVRLRLRRGASPEVFACPLRIHGIDPIPLGADPERAAYEKHFFGHLTALSRRVGDAVLGPPEADGCARVTPGPSGDR